MITDKLPFILDEQYEKNEFELDFVEDLGTLVKYRYNTNMILENNGLQVYLYYNADYLRVVEIVSDTLSIQVNSSFFESKL